MAYDWNAMKQESASVLTPAQVKRDLPIAWVLEHYGYPLEERGGKLVTLCPWHDDTDPSLDVYETEDGSVRVGCLACPGGRNGDVLDLIGWLEGLESFGDKITRAGALIEEYAAARWEGPKLTKREPLDPALVQEVVHRAQAAPDLAAIGALFADRGWPVDPDWVREEFGLGAIEGVVVLPHADARGSWTAYKTRTVGTHWKAASGSRFNELYGTWRDRGLPDVLLTEGESDTWVGASLLPGYDVFGLPTGASSRPRPEQLQRLSGRRVLLCFDGDPAGRAALRVWSEALILAGADVLVAPLPDGYDLSTYGRIPSPRALLPVPLGLAALKEGYIVTQGKTTHTVSNWTFVPTRELVDEHGKCAYEGVLSSGASAILSASDLASRRAAVEWSSAQGLAWLGTDKDAQLLLQALEAEGPYLATGRMVGVVGLHDGHFVLPGRTIGPDYWTYVSPLRPQVEAAIQEHEGEVEPWLLMALLGLHDPRVTHPILAWLAAAPLRSQFGSFPLLAITGSAGTGKTALTEAVSQGFLGGALGMSLTSTTPFGVTAFLSATNALPVWFDEYRPGMRKDTQEMLEQSLRSAYNAQAGFKGTADQTVIVYKALAPIIITGEDTFIERSHLERTIHIPLPAEGRDPKALAAVRSAGFNLGLSYLSWIAEQVTWRMENYEVGPDNLAPRQRINLGVLHAGWELLSQYAAEVLGLSLPDPDFSLVTGEAIIAASEDPTRDAVLWAVGERGGIVWEENGVLYVRVENLVREALATGFVLPGRAAAVRRHLETRYGGKTIMAHNPLFATNGVYVTAVERARLV